MKTETLELEKTIKNALQELQSKTIGLFKPKFSSVVEMVVEDSDGHLITLHVGTLGGLQTLHINRMEGRYVKFPNGKTIQDMMENPMEFQKFYNEHFPETKV